MKKTLMMYTGYPWSKIQGENPKSLAGKVPSTVMNFYFLFQFSFSNCKPISKSYGDGKVGDGSLVLKKYTGA